MGLKSLYEIYRRKIMEGVECHSELNPLLWDEEDKLRPEVREKLLQIVEYFKEYLEIPLTIIDIRLVGSNAAYTYTDKSDIDLHLITHFDDIGSPKGVITALLNCEKSSFNKTYDITIKGLQVEVYVEDMNSSAVSNGVYSITRDEWIKKPIMDCTDIPEVDVTIEVNTFTDKIDDLLQHGSLEDLNTVMDSLYLLRKDSIATDGEFGKGNLIFKELRNKGYLDKLKEKINDLQSKALSLESTRL